MVTEFVEKSLKKVLGPQYGGPALGFEDGKFVVYYWFDGPVGMEKIAEGTTLLDLIKNLDSFFKSKSQEKIEN
jgi:hypothetical protein